MASSVCFLLNLSQLIEDLTFALSGFAYHFPDLSILTSRLLERMVTAFKDYTKLELLV